MTWDLGSLYADDAAWEADFAVFRDALEPLLALKGRLGESPATLKGALHAQDELERVLERARGAVEHAGHVVPESLQSARQQHHLHGPPGDDLGVVGELQDSQWPHGLLRHRRRSVAAARNRSAARP